MSIGGELWQASIADVDAVDECRAAEICGSMGASYPFALGSPLSVGRTVGELLP